MRAGVVVLAGMLLLAGACSKVQEAEPQRAVRAAIESHLREQRNLSISNMTMQLQSVKFSGDTAEAEVRFQSNQQPDVAVSVHYQLRRVGDRWEVVSSSAMGGQEGNPHGGASPQGGSRGPMPPGKPSSPSGLQPESSH